MPTAEELNYGEERLSRERAEARLEGRVSELRWCIRTVNRLPRFEAYDKLKERLAKLTKRKPYKGL